jgi:hypothetical protein
MGAHGHNPIINKVPAALVFNTQAIDKPGEHWVCMYITKRRKGYFFDSFGRHPRQMKRSCWSKLLRDNTHSWTWNRKPVQPVNSPNCGYYVCKTLLELAKGKTLGSVVKRLNERAILQFKKSVK